jgi:hypothetical protein
VGAGQFLAPPAKALNVWVIKEDAE